MSFMELERMVFNSAAYRAILCSDGMRNLVEDATGMMAAEVGESAPYYTQNPILQGGGQRQRWRQSINATGKDGMWAESKVALLRAMETMAAGGGQ